MIIKSRSLKNKNLIKIVSMIILIILLFYINFISYKSNGEIKEVSTNVSIKPAQDAPDDFTLPIIVINTNGEKINEQVNQVEKNGVYLYEEAQKCNATFTLYNGNMESPEINENITINVRGQSSLSLPKKQYTINFKEDDKEKNVEILGMPEDSKWILSASYTDKSLIRNYITYTLASQVMEYAPRVRFVEVFINDTNEELSYSKHYKGVYLVIEKIERGKNRINIQKADERYKDTSFIIARDKIKLKDNSYKSYWDNLLEDYIVGNDGIIRQRSTIKNVYPGPENLTDEYAIKIQDYINEFEGALYSSNFKNPTEGYRKYIDVESFIDMAMINEIVKNIDGCEVSTYFYKDIGGKLVACPVWDFDLSIGNSQIEEVNEPTGFRMVDTIWFNRLFQDEYFCDLYMARYEYLRKNTYSIENINNIIDDVTAKLKTAQEHNYDKWYSKDIDSISYEEEINQIKEFLNKRLDWIDENIQSLQRYEEILE